MDLYKSQDINHSFKCTVLIVEDEDIVRGLVVRALKGRGYHVLAARNGQEALRESEQFKGTIHLLVTDVIMPGMNGQELAQRIIQKRPDIKILYTSGYLDDNLAQVGIESLGSALIQKPFSIESFLRRIQKELSGID